MHVGAVAMVGRHIAEDVGSRSFEFGPGNVPRASLKKTPLLAHREAKTSCRDEDCVS